MGAEEGAQLSKVFTPKVLYWLHQTPVAAKAGLFYYWILPSRKWCFAFQGGCRK